MLIFGLLPIPVSDRYGQTGDFPGSELQKKGQHSVPQSPLEGGWMGVEVSEPPHFLDGSQGLALRGESSGVPANLTTAGG